MKSSNQLYKVGDKVRLNDPWALSFCGTVFEVDTDGEEFYYQIEWHYTDGSENYDVPTFYFQEDLVLATARTMYEALVLGMDGNVNDILKEEAEAI